LRFTYIVVPWRSSWHAFCSTSGDGISLLGAFQGLLGLNPKASDIVVLTAVAAPHDRLVQAILLDPVCRTGVGIVGPAAAPESHGKLAARQKARSGSGIYRIGANLSMKVH